MGNQEIITKAINSAPAYFKSPTHNERLLHVLEMIGDRFGPLQEIEIVSNNPTYKAIYPGKIVKIFKCLDREGLLQKESLYALNVPKLYGKVCGSHEDVWHLSEWVQGVCYRNSINDHAVLNGLEPDLWYKMGELLGKISNLKMNHDMHYIVLDILWTNFVVTNDRKVYLIDLKKIRYDEVPEKWFFLCIFFNRFIRQDQKDAFVDGYLDNIKGPRSRLDLFKTAMDFTRRTYEKLA